MSTHHFDRRMLLADGGRAAVGTALTLGPLIMLDTAPVVTWLLAALALLFIWFAIRTLIRWRSRVVLSAGQIGLEGPRPRTIRWQDLQSVRLAYFAVRRGREQRQPGWLQLTLRGGPRRGLKIDSTLERFDELLAQVHRVALARDLPLDPTTAGNFAALGLGTPDPESEPAAERRSGSVARP